MNIENTLTHRQAQELLPNQSRLLLLRAKEETSQLSEKISTKPVRTAVICHTHCE